MAISARLSSKTQLALSRYCKTHGLTKTEALERGIQLLLRYEGEGAHHPAWISFQQLPIARPSKGQLESMDTLKRHLDEKYPG
jgi:hypothetical protein